MKVWQYLLYNIKYISVNTQITIFIKIFDDDDSQESDERTAKRRYNCFDRYNQEYTMPIFPIVYIALLNGIYPKGEMHQLIMIGSQI